MYLNVFFRIRIEEEAKRVGVVSVCVIQTFGWHMQMPLNHNTIQKVSFQQQQLLHHQQQPHHHQQQQQPWSDLISPIVKVFTHTSFHIHYSFHTLNSFSSGKGFSIGTLHS